MENPYAPPQTAPAPSKPQGKPWPIGLAVLIGLVVDIASTIAMGIVATIGIFSVMIANGMSLDDIDLHLDDDSPSTFFFYALGLGGSMLGGYVCGRLATGREVKAGLIVGVIVSLLGVATDASTGSSVLLMVTLSMLTLAATGFGASLASKRAFRVQATDDRDAVETR